jgi:hypothetical protein
LLAQVGLNAVIELIDDAAKALDYARLKRPLRISERQKKPIGADDASQPASPGGIRPL